MVKNNNQFEEISDNKKSLIIGSVVGAVFLALVLVCLGITFYKSTNNKMATAYISSGDDGYNTIEPTGTDEKKQSNDAKDDQYYAVSDYSDLNYDNSIDCHRNYVENGIEYYEESSFLFKNEQLIYNQQFWACKSVNFNEEAKDVVLTNLNNFGKNFEKNGYVVTSAKKDNFVYLKAALTISPENRLLLKDYTIEYVKQKYDNKSDDDKGNFKCDTKDSL